MINIEKCKDEILNNNFKVSLDSRLVRKGEYFVAVKGENHDGHVYIEDVLARDAVGVLEVEELFTLANFKIEHIKPKIVGITGSTGKSSVTSFVTQILSTKYNVCTGTLNTKLGLSVDVINKMDLKCEVFVAEMGMNGLGQIKAMVDMFPPHISVITTINQTHAEKLGSVKNIAKAKSEIISNTTKDDVAVLNADNVHCRSISKSFKGKVIWFGVNTKSDYNLNNTDLALSKLLGLHNKLNLLASMAVCKEIGMSVAEIGKAVPSVTIPKGRLNLIEGIRGSSLIDDTYNASPASTMSAIDVISSFPKRNKVAIIGDMLELGRFSTKYHRQIGMYLKGKGIDTLVVVGNLATEIATSAVPFVNKIYQLEKSTDFENIKNELSINEETVILIKGSQGVRMEKITKQLMKNPEDAERLLVRQDIRWK